MFIDYYEILACSQDATDEQIKKAYREQAMKWHPDKNKGIDTTLQMQKINEAYILLKDKEARARYDVQYEKFKKFKENKQRVSEEENSNKQNNQRQNNKYDYSDFKIDDELLKKWMSNAKRQSVELAKQTIEDFKGISKSAGSGCLQGITNLIIFICVIFVLSLLLKTCN